VFFMSAIQHPEKNDKVEVMIWLIRSLMATLFGHLIWLNKLISQLLICYHLLLYFKFNMHIQQKFVKW
jgi:hypothetical protein